MSSGCSANAVEAAEQTERLSVPDVRAPVDLMRLLADWPAERRLLMCDETGGGPPIGEALAGLDDAARAAPWAIVIGPEGGFAETELSALRRMKDVMAVGAWSAHPARRHRGAGGAGLLAEHGRRLAEADAEITERLPHIAWRRLEPCARPCRYGTGDSEHHEPAAGSREESSCDRAASHSHSAR